jgi:membrane protein YdbS with pleckstrin-like domain
MMSHSLCKAAIAFVIALWVVVLFVLFSIWPALTVTSAGLLVLNTAAIVAMLQHYHHHKHFIYSLDPKHLNEMRQRRSG